MWVMPPQAAQYHLQSTTGLGEMVVRLSF